MGCCPAAILAKDVVGYTRFMSEDEMSTIRRFRRCARGDREPLIADHGDGW